MSHNAHLLGGVQKARARLLPFMILMYIMAFLDRANIGFAKQAFQADTGISNAAFALGAGVFFVGYALFEVPSNILLARIGARLWLSRIMVTWGLVASAMMFAHDETTFYILRFLLGAAEAGFFPGIILYLTYWFPERARGQAIGIFYFAIPIALVLGSPISGALLDLDGVMGLHGWKCMFMVEGLLTVAVGVWAFFYLDDSLASAAWLQPEEKAAMRRALAEEDAAKASHSPVGAWRALLDPRVAFFSGVFFLIQVAVYGLIFYLPSIVAQLLGEKVGLVVGLVAAIPWAISIVTAYYVTRWSDRTGKRRGVVVGLFAAMGVALGASLYLDGLWSLVAISIAACGYFAATPLFWTLPTAYLSTTAAAAGIALINSLGNLGGAVAPSLKTWVEQQFASDAAGMLVMGIVAVLSAMLLFCLRPLSRPISSEE